MTAGRALDALVAEHIMGLAPCKHWTAINLGSAGGPAMARGVCGHVACYPEDTNGWPGSGPARYSTDIAAAWIVINKLRDRYTNVSLHAANGWGLSLGRIYVNEESEEGELIEEWTAPINANTAPLAICLAALRAFGVSI